MGDYFKGEKISTIYQQFVGIGAADDRDGVHATTLKKMWTDDGDGGTNEFPFMASRQALLMTGTYQLQFQDTGTYINSGADSRLNLVADGELDLTAGSFDFNSSGAVAFDGTTIAIAGTDASSFSVAGGNLTLTTTSSGEIFITPVTYARIATNKQLQFGDAGEYISGDDTNLTIASGADIILSATSNVNIPQTKGLSFATDDAERIISDGTDLTISSGAKINLTCATGDVHIPKNIGLVFDDNASEKIESNNTDLTINSGADINLTATSDINIPASVGLTFGSAANPKIEGDGTDLAIDVAGNINVTSTVDEANAIYLHANAGTGETIKIHADQGTGASAATESDASITLASDAGGIGLLSGLDAVNAIRLEANGGVSENIIIHSNQGTSVTDGAASIQLLSDAGGIGIKSSKNAANALYLHANGGISETIKVHADQGTGAASIELTSDVGGIGINTTTTGKSLDINTAILDVDASEASNITMATDTGSTTNLTIEATNSDGSYSSDIIVDADGKVHVRSNDTGDVAASAANAGVQIGTDLANVDVNIGHGTGSIVNIANDLTVGGTGTFNDLTATGTVSIGAVTYTAQTVSHTAPYATFTNTTHENSDLDGSSDTAAGREVRLIFKGEKSDGTAHELATLVTGHNGTSDDKKGQMQFFVNDGSDTDGALTNVMNIIETGCVGVGTATPAKTIESVNSSASQLRLSHTAGSKFCDFTVDTNHDITISPSSTGQVKFSPTTDSTDFFTVEDADGGTPIFTVDSTNERVGVGVATPLASLHVTQPPGDNVNHGIYLFETTTPALSIHSAGNGVVAYDAREEGSSASHGSHLFRTAGAGLVTFLKAGSININAQSTNSATLGLMGVSGQSDGYAAGVINFYADGGTSTFAQIIGERGSHDTKGDIIFRTRDGGLTERVRIDEDGNVGIGIAAPESLCHIKETDDVLSATKHVLQVEDSHATVDAGDVLVRLDYSGDANVHADLAKFISFHDNGGEIGYVATSTDGVISVDILGSDIRLKTDIQDTSLEGLSTINALKIRDFKWGDKANPNLTGKQIIGGWIADEVYEVYSKAVHGKPGQMMDVKDETGKKTGEKVMNPMGLSASQFIAPMMKAIQELSAKVTALEKAK